MKRLPALLASIMLAAAALCSCSAQEQGPVCFAYFGDTQAEPETGDYTPFKELAAAAKADADFFIIGGDMVNEETDENEWSHFFAAAGASKIYTAAGNHTKGSGYTNRFELPQNGPDGYKSLFYSFDAGDAHIVVLDSNTMGSNDQSVIDVINSWLKQDLAGTDKTAIAVLHHPIFPVTDVPKDKARAESMRQNYLPAMLEGGVRLILCGHQHMYARTDDSQGIVQIMGVASEKSYTEPNTDHILCIAHEPVYTLISVTGRTINITTKNADGKTIDTATV